MKINNYICIGFFFHKTWLKLFWLMPLNWGIFYYKLLNINNIIPTTPKYNQV